MNTENMISSIYNPKKKGRDSLFFPKITKQDSPSPASKVFARAASRKYNQHNIFKIDDDKREKLKFHLADEKIKETQNRECEQLEAKIAEMLRRHQDELREIQQSQKQVVSKIQSTKKEHYHIKLNIWQLKNEVMNLNAQLLDQEAELQRLEALFPQYQGQYEEEYMEGQQEIHNEEQHENGQLVASNVQDGQGSLEHE